MVEDDKWQQVETLLEADMPHLEHEAAELYDQVERYGRRASVLSGAGEDDEAEYFRELAVDAYDSFVGVVQLKKDADDYNF